MLVYDSMAAWQNNNSFITIYFINPIHLHSSHTLVSFYNNITFLRIFRQGKANLKKFTRHEKPARSHHDVASTTDYGGDYTRSSF